ncbi:hypothetical protein BH11BAC6_BH11BAC6_13950 [soil metagenome]
MIAPTYSMENTFTISYNNTAIRVAESGKDSKGNIEYIVHLPGGDMHLQHAQDDEGAGRWIDRKSENETEESGDIGQLIELHKVQENA